MFQKLGFDAFGEVFDKISLWLELEFLLHLVGLVDVVADCPFEVVFYVVVLDQSPSYLQVFVFFYVLGANIRNQGAHAVYIIGQKNAAEGFYESETKCFFVIGWGEIAEPDSQHRGCSPIKCPNILLNLGVMQYLSFSQPVLPWLQVAHRDEKNCRNMSEKEVD